jgi:hypothetical protein
MSIFYIIMENTTENEYLEMANHCKELLERKDKVIAVYKHRLNEIEGELRVMNYMLTGINYLIEYKQAREKEECKKNIDKTFYELLKRDHKKLLHFIETLRDMSELTEEDEEIAILTLVNM